MNPIMSAVALNRFAENEVTLPELTAAGPLQDYEELLHLIWDNSSDGLRLTDGAGVTVKVNDAFCRMVALSREELVGRPFDIIHGEGETAPAVRQSRKRADSKGNILRVETEFVLWNGKRKWFEISNLTFEPADSGQMLLSVFRELGDR